MPILLLWDHRLLESSLQKELVKEYLSVEWDPNCRSVDKVQRIVDFEKRTVKYIRWESIPHLIASDCRGAQ